MGVTVTPQEFHYVYFDASAIADVATDLLEQLGMAERELRIEVDETTPIARISIDVGDPLVVHAESGALEDTRRPRQLSSTPRRCAPAMIPSSYARSRNSKPSPSASVAHCEFVQIAYAPGRAGRITTDLHNHLLRNLDLLASSNF